MVYDIAQSGERIRQLRKQNGYTQERLAQMLNIDRSFYSRIESGKSGCSIELFVHISELFGVSLDYLILGKYSKIFLNDSERTLIREDIDNLVNRLEQLKTKF